MKQKNFKGFTLVELLVVIAVIGILSTILTVTLNRARDKARIAKALTELRQISLAVRLLYEDTGKWPAHMDDSGCPVHPALGWSYEPFEEFNCEMSMLPYTGREHLDLLLPWFGLTGLDPANQDHYPDWNGPYLPATFPRTDPWGKTYILDGDYLPYQTDLNTVSIMSGGPDRRTGSSSTSSYKADDLYAAQCYYLASACAGHTYCPCTERP